MSEIRRRWYAPEVRRWRGGALSRDRALGHGRSSAFLAVCFGGIALFTDRGPIISTVQWLCVCGLVLDAFAHAAFNTTARPEERGAGRERAVE